MNKSLVFVSGYFITVYFLSFVSAVSSDTTVEKEKITAVTKDFELERLKCQQITAKFDEKSKQFQKLQTMYEKLKRKTINPILQDAMPSPQQQPHQQPPPSAPAGMPHQALGSGPFRLYHTNNYARPPRPPYSSGGQPDEDLMSRIGRASNITGGRSVFVPPQSPAAQSYHSRFRHDHHRPSRIPSPSIVPDNSMFSYRHHPPRREGMEHESQMPPTATATSDFYHQRPPPPPQQQHEQQMFTYQQHTQRRNSSPASQYYHKFADKSRQK
ncbi:hypothetical protein MBANPS3_010807 [Mucor bainieri]